jgi:hypothetical protein
MSQTIRNFQFEFGSLNNNSNNSKNNNNNNNKTFDSNMNTKKKSAKDSKQILFETNKKRSNSRASVKLQYDLDALKSTVLKKNANVLVLPNKKNRSTLNIFTRFKVN